MLLLMILMHMQICEIVLIVEDVVLFSRFVEVCRPPYPDAQTEERERESPFLGEELN